MPQELQVLRCYSCETFQVDIVKKKAKWSCKMCGEKQSVKKVFHRGNGKECRLHVQELNEKRMSENETLDKPENNKTKAESENICLDKSKNKWFEFMEDSEDEENTNIENFNGVFRKTKRKLDTDEESKPGGKVVSKWTQPVSAENYVEGVDHRKEVRKINNSDSEPGGSKWDEFNEGRSYSISNITKDESSNNNGLSNKKCKPNKVTEPEYEKNILEQSNIFETDSYGDIDSFLEI